MSQFVFQNNDLSQKEIFLSSFIRNIEYKKIKIFLDVNKIVIKTFLY